MRGLGSLPWNIALMCSCACFKGFSSESLIFKDGKIMTLITVDMVTKWRQFQEWPREWLTELLGDGLTPLAFASLETISVTDRLWILLHEDVLPGRMGNLAQAFADHVKHLIDPAGINSTKASARHAAASKERAIEGAVWDAANHAFYAAYYAGLSASGTKIADDEAERIWQIAIVVDELLRRKK
jgi:hypothetical protein